MEGDRHICKTCLEVYDTMREAERCFEQGALPIIPPGTIYGMGDGLFQAVLFLDVHQQPPYTRSHHCSYWVHYMPKFGDAPESATVFEGNDFERIEELQRDEFLEACCYFGQPIGIIDHYRHGKLQDLRVKKKEDCVVLALPTNHG